MLSQALTKIGFCFLGVLVLGVGRSRVRADINAGQFLVDIWKPDEGVPNNSVTGFAQGTDGYLWMISDQALARFDGNRFVDVLAEKFAPSPVEWDGPLLRYAGRLFDGSSGSVWLTTTAGDLWRWQGREFQPWFPKKTTSRAFVRIFELPGNEVLALSSSGRLFRGNQIGMREIADCAAQGRPLPDTVSRDVDGRIWFLTERAKVVRMDPEGHIESPSPSEVEGKPLVLASDQSRKIWLGTDHGLFVWRRDHFEQFPLPGPDQRFPVQNILPGLDDQLWVSWQGKAWLLRNGKWKGPAGEWPNDVRPYARLVDRAGRLWLAPPHRGVWCLQPEEQTLQLGPEQGLSADAVALFCDREGDVWISIYRTGVARIRERRFASVNVMAGMHTTPLWNVAEDGSGAIWFSPEYKGPVRWCEGKETEFNTSAGGHRTGMWTKALAVDRSGRVWAARMGVGLFRFEDDSFQPELPWPRGAGFARVLYQDRAGRWWLGSDSGLHCWSSNQWHACDVAQGLPKQAVRSIAEDSEGRLWVGTFGGGVARLDGDTFTCFGQEQGVIDQTIYTLCPGADGSLWMGTHGGLVRWRAGRFSSYTTDDGLPDNCVVQLLEDGNGFLWAGTRSGLCRIAIASLNALDRGKTHALECMVFDQHDGLPTGVFQDRGAPACWRAHDGRLWFLTAGAAVYCRPDHIMPNAVRPPVMIEQVMLDGQPWSPPQPPANQSTPEALGLSALAIKAPAKLELSPGPHALEIHYTAASLAVAEKVRFEYKIEGLDQDWLKADSRRAAFCSFLPPGQYRFRVRACNNDGLWNERGAELAIAVQPYFWQTRWFPGLMAFALAGMSGGGVALLQRSRHHHQLVRLEFQRAKEAERTRISRNLHDHLGASLTEIGMLAADGADSRRGLEPTGIHCRAILQKVHSAVSELDGLVWAVDPRQDSLASLASYLGSFVEEYARACSLDCRVDIQRELPGWVLTSDARHSLLLAVTEAVHNAVRHARGREIALRLAVIERQLEITISDNGCGFDPSLAVAGNGLTNLRERLASLSGSCQISSQPGAGTTVTLVCPRPDSHSL